jgi:3'-phosphoadenosine 5'-phosphosulfate sulfotransferase (PAPS reductase)/FAD synthetase
MSVNLFFIVGPTLISFSGGRTSAYMLWRILQAHGGTLPPDVHVVFANTGKERPETLDFVQECATRWDVNIVWLEYQPGEPNDTAIVNHNSASRHGEPFAALIKRRNFLPNPVTRFCTVELKIRRMKHFMHAMNGYDRWVNVVGLRADEAHRVLRKAAQAPRERWSNAFPLYEAGVTKADVGAFWAGQPFDLRLMNVRNVTPQGNCDLCFLKGESTIRGLLRLEPSAADWWAAQEREMASISAPEKGMHAARFRADRPSYAEMKSDALRQGDLFPEFEGESVDCACTD